MNSPDWIVVGAGLSGASAARELAEAGARVRIIEQRTHVAGNAFDEISAHGPIHRYGPHIFHTNSDAVFAYLSRFTEWRPYEHRVLAEIDGQRVPVPFNLDSIDALFAPADAHRLAAALIARYGRDANVPILRMRETSDPDLRELADYVYRKLFDGYTRKQWGISAEALSPSVTARVPLRVSRDSRYFQDRHQQMPRAGYSAMVARMLAHPRIDLRLATAFGPAHDPRDRAGAPKLLFTGAIDEFFGNCFGPLPYRSLRFETVARSLAERLPVGTLNFPNAHDYTRITEQSILTGGDGRHALQTYEYPCPHVPGQTLPYYPIPTDANRRAYQAYADAADALGDRVHFVGRLGTYQYLNMDQAVAAALHWAKGQCA